ncbi:putative hemoglobin and hemoglobin-haptoglobin-binding protein 3 precursor [Serratia ficaria]|nr:putative hemoglobin and hemoglobin-haptoglobin-binding protein 3 precursor [Serratia ficaria]
MPARNNKKNTLKLNGVMLSGILAGLSLNSHAAITDDPAGKNTKDGTAQEEQLTVYGRPIVQKPGSATVIGSEDMQKHGGNDFGTLMRYQPLIGATGSSSGSGAGKSGFDRAGYTGYNIRGLESNRVGIEVDGISLPNATGRSYVGRAGLDTFGIGRDYIDPYMYGQVGIESGATPVDRANGAIGGAVSFQPKSADRYLTPEKSTYFGYQSDYDSANRSWHNGITAAAGDQNLRGVLVVSRRDGQQTRNNSDSRAAYPMNWHSTAIMASGLWQATDEHLLTGTVDLYDKTSHSRFDSWNSAGSAILGTARQTSDTRRWSLGLKDEWTPYSDLVDRVETRLYYQKSEAHDDTYMPQSSSSWLSVLSDYNVSTYGFETRMLKSLGRHDLSWGLNAKQSRTERPFTQDPLQSAYNEIMQPEADSRSYALGGFLQDQINFDLDGHAAALTPGVRVVHQNTQARNLSSLSSADGVLSTSEVSQLYGSANSDTQVLPALSLMYNLTPKLMTYLQYQRGAQFPDASQLYGSWNLSSSYAGTQQYALIGNTHLKTETSNNVEWGVKGEAIAGVSIHTALFYNSYKNFIANTRYTRAANPQQFANVPSNIYTIYQAENRDKAYIWGGEISSKVNFGTWFPQVNGLSATLAFGYSEGKAKSSYLGDKYVDLDSVAPMKAVIGLAWDDPAQRYGAAITSTFQKGKKASATSRQSYSNSGGSLADPSAEYMRVPGYGLVDLSAYWQVARHVKLSGGVYNLTDRKYWDYLSSRQLTEVTQQDAYNKQLATQPGRSFQLGVNVDF